MKSPAFTPYAIVGNKMDIPRALYRYPNISIWAKMLYCILARICNGKTYSVAHIDFLVQEIMYCDRRAVFRKLQELKQDGFLKIQRRGWRAPIFHFLPHPILTGLRRRSDKPPSPDEEPPPPDPITVVKKPRKVVNKTPIAKVVTEPLTEVVSQPLRHNPHHYLTETYTEETYKQRSVHVYGGKGVIEMNSKEEQAGSLFSSEDVNTMESTSAQQLTEPEAEPEAEHDELYLDDPVEDWLKNAYRQHRGAKLENLRAKANASLVTGIREKEQSIGKAEFRLKVLAWLSSDNEWLRQHKWPIRAFLKRGWPSTTTQAPPIERRPVSAPAVPILQVVPNGNPPEKMPIETWERHNPDAPVHWKPEYDTSESASKSLNDKLFRDSVDIICGKAAQLREKNSNARSWLTFRWLLRQSREHGWNWYRIYTGEFDWMLNKSDANDGMSVIDAYLRESVQ